MADKKPQILVVADFPFYQTKVHGGLQRRLFPVLESLAVHYDVQLFCGEGSDIQLQNVKVYEAYNLQCVLLERYTKLLNQLSEQVDMLLSLETAYLLPKPEKKILIMGGMAYDWSWEVVKSSEWTRIIVPSEHAQKLLAEGNFQSEVISNGYNWSSFIHVSSKKNRWRTSSKKILISPHRPDAAKGHFEAIQVTSNLLKRGMDCILRIPKQDFFMTRPNFYDKLSEYAHEHIGSDNFILDSWIDSGSMSQYYDAADLTLALGSAQEGFGAVIVESITCGTPVLATRRGAIPTLVPEGSGLFLIDIDEQATEKTTNLIASIITRQLPSLDESLEIGRQYICFHYDEKNMTQRYLDLISKVIDPIQGI